MNKIIKFASLAAGIAMILPLAASASTTMNFLTLNDLPNVTVDQGSTLDAKINLDLTSPSTVQSVKWELIGSGLPPVCVNVDDINTSGTFVVNFPVDTAGATQGTWDFRATTYGDIPPASNNNCNGTEGTNVIHDFMDQVTLTQNLSTGSVINSTGHGSGSGTGSVSAIDQLTALVTQLAAQVSCITTGGTFAANVCTHAPTSTPNTSTVCTQLNGFLANAMAGTRSPANIKLQGFLLEQGMSIPALAAGASFGFDGPQTQAAVVAFETQNHCN